RATRAASGASKPRSGPAPSGAGRRRWTMPFAEGNATMRDPLGGKGPGLAEMSRIGLPVPPGFTITTEACLEYYRRSRQFPAGLMDEVRQKMLLLEERTGKRFGDATKPLLVSVRSGAKFSMPGMMDTVLNLGLNKTTVEGLARASGDARFAYDSYRRFMQMFGNVVLGLKHELFEDILLAAKRARGVTQDTELSAGDLGARTEEYRGLVRERAGQECPGDPPGVPAVHGRVCAAGEALPRRAGRRVHHRTRHALPVADAQREAHRTGRGQDCRRHGAREADHQRRGAVARGTGVAGTAPAS